LTPSVGPTAAGKRPPATVDGREPASCNLRVGRRFSPGLVHRRETASYMNTGRLPLPLSVIGGFTYPRRRGSLLRGRIDWPLARATLEPEAVVLRPRGPVKHVVPSIIVPYIDLIDVDRTSTRALGRLGGSLRFRWSPEDPQTVVFFAWRRDLGRLIEGLSGFGVDVRPAP
jgi:hypothetical protein